MIFTDRTITVQKGASSIDEPIILYRGDKEAEIRFALNEKVPFKFGSGTDSNMIEKTEAAYGQLIIKTPNGLPSIFSDVAPTKKGQIIFKITAEMIDEVTEVGKYTFQIRLLDEGMNARVTLPEVNDGIEIREPIALEDYNPADNSNEVNIARANNAAITYAVTIEAFDEQGNYIETQWNSGDIITTGKLNKIEAGITGVNEKIKNVTIPTNISQLTNDSGYITNIPDEYITETELNAKGYATTSQIPTVPTNVSEFTNDAHYASETFVNNKIAEAQLGGGSGTVDLSGYVTKETGNANQITFADGQTFQAKLDAGTLKGEKGDPGIQGEQGPAGANGQDGLTTAISVNGTTYTHVDGVITLPNYPSSTGEGATTIDAYTKNETDAIIQEYTDGKKQKYVTQAEYDILPNEQKNDASIIWNIIDGEELSVPQDLVLNNNTLQLKDKDGQTIGAGVELYTLPVASNTVLGGVKIGDRLSIDSNGVLSADIQQGSSGSISTDEIVLVSPSGYKFKLNVTDDGTLSTEQVINYGEIVLSTNTLAVDEGNSTSFTVKLDSAPTNTQSVNIATDNSSVTIEPTSLNFTNTDYNNPQTVTITVPLDENTDNEECIITVSSDNVANKTISLAVTDTTQSGGQVITPTKFTLSLADKSLNALELKPLNTYALDMQFEPEGATDTVSLTKASYCTITADNQLFVGLFYGFAGYDCYIRGETSGGLKSDLRVRGAITKYEEIDNSLLTTSGASKDSNGVYTAGDGTYISFTNSYSIQPNEIIIYELTVITGVENSNPGFWASDTNTLTGSETVKIYDPSGTGTVYMNVCNQTDSAISDSTFRIKMQNGCTFTMKAYKASRI